MYLSAIVTRYKKLMLFSLVSISALCAMEQQEIAEAVPTLKTIAIKAILSNPQKYNDIERILPTDLHDDVRDYWIKNNRSEIIAASMEHATIPSKKMSLGWWFLNGMDPSSVPTRFAVWNGTKDKILTGEYNYARATLWDKNGYYLTTLQGHTNDLRSAAFNKAGDRIVTASNDATAKIWDLHGTCLATLQGHTENVCFAMFNNAGDRIVTASDDKTARLWNLQGNCLVIFKGHTQEVKSAVFNNANTMIATASCDGTIKLWDLNENCHINYNYHATLHHQGPVESVAFNNTDTLMLTASRDGMAKLWDMHGYCLTTYDLEYYGGVSSAIFNSAGNKILTASHGFKLWDLHGTCLAEIPEDDIYHTRSAVFNATDTHIVTLHVAKRSFPNHVIKTWDLSPLINLEHYISNIPIEQLLLLTAAMNAHKNKTMLTLTKKEKDVLQNITQAQPALARIVQEIPDSWYEQVPDGNPTCVIV